jgi:hypothetical protein
MKNVICIIILVSISFYSIAQDTLLYPVDVVYRAETENYYVSNWADGNGYILKLNAQGEVVQTFYEGLHYPGGMCLVGDILYIADNLQIWSTSAPHNSYILGIDINTAQLVLNFEVATGGTYLDLMDTDNNGNLYIGNTRDGGNNGIVHKFNIQTQQLTDLASNITKPFGVCFDPISNRVLFTNSSSSLSFIKSISPDGGQITNVYYTNGYLEGIMMHPNGDFFLSSWGTVDAGWGNEPVIKTVHDFSWEFQLYELHDRPYGMCFGKDNFLVICNWGDHSLSFIDLELYGIEESIAGMNDFSIYPNPSGGIVYLKFNNPEIQESMISIRDICGKEVYQEKINRKDILSEKEIDLNMLPAGTYIVNIFDGQSVSHQKLIIR